MPAHLVSPVATWGLRAVRGTHIAPGQAAGVLAFPRTFGLRPRNGAALLPGAQRRRITLRASQAGGGIFTPLPPPSSPKLFLAEAAHDVASTLEPSPPKSLHVLTRYSLQFVFCFFFNNRPGCAVCQRVSSLCHRTTPTRASTTNPPRSSCPPTRWEDRRSTGIIVTQFTRANTVVLARWLLGVAMVPPKSLLVL